MNFLPAFFVVVFSLAMPVAGFAQSAPSGWGMRAVDGTVAADYQLHWSRSHRIDNTDGWFQLTRSAWNIDSEGTFVGDSKVKNGTTTSIGGSVFCALSMPEYINGLWFSLAGRMETIQTSNQLLEGLATQSAGGTVGVKTSLFNAPVQKFMGIVISTGTEFYRSVQGIQLDTDFYIADARKGGAAALSHGSSRWDLGLGLELPFQSKLIVKGKWNYSREFRNTPNNEFKYTEIQVGQRIGDADDKSKRYMYIQWSKGAKAPDFQDKEETSIGYAAYF